MEEIDETAEQASEEASASSETPAISSEADTASEPETADAPEKQPAEALTPKARRQRTRAQKASKRTAVAAQTPEEKREARAAERAAKAVARRRRRVAEREKARAASGSVQPTAAREHQVGFQKTRQGVVVSDKADKTITVRIDVVRRHKRYHKIMRTSIKLHAHDESNDAGTGDTVRIVESRPLSRTKRWRLVEVLERAK